MTDLVVVDFLVVCAVSVTALKQFLRRFVPPVSHRSYGRYVDRERISRGQADD